MRQYSFTLVLSLVIVVLLSGQIIADTGCDCSGYTPESCGGYYCYNQDTGAKITWGTATGDCRTQCCGSSTYTPKYVPAKIWLNNAGTAMGGWCCPGNPDTPCSGSSDSTEPATPPGNVTEPEPVTPTGSVTDTEPVAPASNVTETEPVTPTGSVTETEPVTPASNVTEPEPVTPIDNVTETEPVSSTAETITKSIILLFDASGSMADDNKIVNAKSAANLAIRDLSDTTEIALIVFSDCGKIDVVQPFTTNKNSIASKIDQIIPEGSTPLADALDFANNYKKNARSNERTIVLFTDGIETCR